MKKQKKYTFIIASNTASSSRSVTVSQKQIYTGVASVLLIGFIVVAFVTDYVQLNIDQWKLSSLKKENKELKQNLSQVQHKFKNLETKLKQVQDFSQKLKLITTVSVKNSHLGYGKLSSDSQILALSQDTSQRHLASVDSAPEEEEFYSLNSKQSPPSYEYANPYELEVRIENLAGKSQLVKQDMWKLYTTLLEKQEFINNTPNILPAEGVISSSYGYRNETVFVDHQPKFHKGLDIASRRGAPVVATADGKVTYTGYDELGYGNIIIIDHGYNLKTYYAHLSEIQIDQGAYVRKGQSIGTVGNTGKSTGPHLHYEVRIFDRPVNPENYILDTL